MAPVAHLGGGGPGGHGPPVKSRGTWEKANTPPFEKFFLNFFSKKVSKGGTLWKFFQKT